MRGILAVAGLLVVGYVLPASAESFYLVRDPEAMHCRIVNEKPVIEKTAVVNPDGAMYMTRSDAEVAMKIVGVCNE